MMNEKLKTILSVALTVVLLVGAVCIGSVRGWREERTAAAGVLTDAGVLQEDLAVRAMDAANLLVVASRHLPGNDPDLQAMRQALVVFRQEDAGLREIMAADAEITRLAAAWGDALPLMDSVKASARDQAYVSALTGALRQGADTAEVYRTQAAAFNKRMGASVTGQLAMLLGVEPLPQE